MNESKMQKQKPITRREPVTPILDSEYGYMSDNKSALSLPTLKNKDLYQSADVNTAAVTNKSTKV